MGRPSGSRPSAVQTVTKLTSRVLAVPSGCLPRRPSTAPARAPAPCRRSASAPARVSTSTILVAALPHLICYRETVVASQLLLPKEATMSTISPGTRQELVTAVADRYRQSTAAEKRLILDEFVALTGYHRKHAVRVLNGSTTTPRARPGRRCVYDAAVTEGLIVLWEASDRMCGKRLKALLPTLVPALEHHGHLSLDPAVRERLLAVSAATIDRRLASARAVTAGQRRRRRSALNGLRSSVPVRTFGDWKDPAPGFVEADLVAHCGGTLSGSFVWSLVLTDIASGWTECVPLLVREARLVVDALDHLRGALPFPLRGIDTDNGSEFLNEVLVAFCREQGIELTRSRPYRKNDQAWVEQKNGAVVRRMVGYGRLEGVPAAEALARLYSAARLFVNVFQPSLSTGARNSLLSH